MLLSILLGLAIGVVMALTGAGGGILAVPLLVFGLHLGVAQAGPVGLLAVGIAAAVGAVLGLREGIVRYRAALLVALTGMLFAPLGLWLARQVDNRWLTVLFALTLLFVAWRTYRKATQPVSREASTKAPTFIPPCLRRNENGRFVWTRSCAQALAITGSMAGLLSGLLGVGGGFVMVPALQRKTDLPMNAIVATSLAVIALISITGVVSSAASGTLAWDIAVPFSAGAVSGMLGGRAIAARLAGARLQIGFAAVSALVAIGMIAKATLPHWN